MPNPVSSNRQDVDQALQRRIIKSKIRFTLWRWHRRIGILSAIFVLLLSLTGILLNHTNAWRLNQASLPQSFAAAFYGMTPPVIKSTSENGMTLSQLDGKALYFGEQAIGTCQGKLVGAVFVDEIWVLACSNEVILLSPNGQLIDRKSTDASVTNIGRCQSNVCIEYEEDQVQINLDTLELAASIGHNLESMPLQTPPPALEAKLRQQYGSSITWERWIQDLHSGRLIGAWGVYLMDGMAILFVLIALSGIVMWSLGKRRNKR